MRKQKDNVYELLSKDEDKNELCEKMIDKAIDEFVDRMKVLHKKFPKCGLGDTATDEAIVGAIYREIHQL